MLRELRAAWSSRVIDETFAWSSLAANLTVLPGLGTLAARRYLSGGLQMAIAVTGHGLSVSWLVLFLRQWADEAAFPWDGGPHFPVGLLGVLVFGVAWLWALATSLSILREARRRALTPATVLK